ncbi:hypothetical protein XU18_1387 [Perkinsela sp. CCAP 1560/4]|nr:hypothetical protein XU18_1387 [Perkinsela sp. CCAP 1560/4]|eukprot:KNH08057.1 hypothetical protein XU18_1387 [Perkinsela sp. CCAP 1560/4]
MNQRVLARILQYDLIRRALKRRIFYIAVLLVYLLGDWQRYQYIAYPYCCSQFILLSMLRRIALRTRPSNTSYSRFPLSTETRRKYWVGMFQNPVRRPQLSEEDRKQVIVNQDNWPQEFKDYDPEDPYKYSPDWIEGLTSISLFLGGIELAFVFSFFELCFPYSI